MKLRILVVAALLALPATAAADEFSPEREGRNYSKINEREAEYSTPEYQAELRRRSVENQGETTRIKAEDPERNFDATLCGTRSDGCAGDVRLYDWEAKGHGLSRPVLFTARNGAVLSGRVWATRSGPAERPGIVITDGSVQAPEQLYWFAATNLTKRGYVVLTFDPQGQGPLRRLRRGRRRERGRARPAGAPVLRQHRGRARPATPATTRCGSCSTRATSGSPGTPSAPRASPSSASATRA